MLGSTTPELPDEGPLPAGGAVELLRHLETERVSGILHFESEVAGAVTLHGGQLSLSDEPADPDPVEAFLAAREGRYRLERRLPLLAVTQGDASERRGSLSVHGPADLMAYCDQAGLTGTLELVREGRRVEIAYERGELRVIRIDGEESADLESIFAWDSGRFRIRCRPRRDIEARVPAVEDSPEREPTIRFARPRREDTGVQLLRMVEVALTDVLVTRERSRRTAPSDPPKAHPSVPPRPVAPRADSTVRVVWTDDRSAREADPAESPPLEPAAPAAAHAAGASPAWWVVVLVLLLAALGWFAARGGQ